eukprot:GHVL01019338.1.p1 GENE.GHVL01019338.1~~GHVL01019338.1.p1  ORF type:complete len:822 (-),score=182.40 GHVL01019338.1:40-2154(-)
MIVCLRSFLSILTEKIIKIKYTINSRLVSKSIQNKECAAILMTLLERIELIVTRTVCPSLVSCWNTLGGPTRLLLLLILHPSCSSLIFLYNSRSKLAHNIINNTSDNNITDIPLIYQKSILLSSVLFQSREPLLGVTADSAHHQSTFLCCAASAKGLRDFSCMHHLLFRQSDSPLRKGSITADDDDIPWEALLHRHDATAEELRRWMCQAVATSFGSPLLGSRWPSVYSPPVDYSNILSANFALNIAKRPLTFITKNSKITDWSCTNISRAVQNGPTMFVDTISTALPLNTQNSDLPSFIGISGVGDDSNPCAYSGSAGFTSAATRIADRRRKTALQFVTVPASPQDRFLRIFRLFAPHPNTSVFATSIEGDSSKILLCGFGDPQPLGYLLFSKERYNIEKNEEKRDRRKGSLPGGYKNDVNRNKNSKSPDKLGPITSSRNVGYIKSIKWGPMGDRLMSTTSKGMLFMWALQERCIGIEQSGGYEPYLSFRPHTSCRSAAYLSPNGGVIASAGRGGPQLASNNISTTSSMPEGLCDASVCVWDCLSAVAGTRRSLLMYDHGHDKAGAKEVLTWSPRNWLISCGKKGGIRVLDLRQRKLTASWMAHSNGLFSAMACEKTDSLVTVGNDSVVKVWSLTDPGKLIMESEAIHQEDCRKQRLWGNMQLQTIVTSLVGAKTYVTSAQLLSATHMITSGIDGSVKLTCIA